MNGQLITTVILRLQYKNTTENFVKEIMIRRCIKNKINILKSNSIKLCSRFNTERWTWKRIQVKWDTLREERNYRTTEQIPILHLMKNNFFSFRKTLIYFYIFFFNYKEINIITHYLNIHISYILIMNKLSQ